MRERFWLDETNPEELERRANDFEKTSHFGLAEEFRERAKYLRSNPEGGETTDRMTEAQVLALIAERDALAARQIIEARLGRSLGPIATMPRDLRRALYLLALQLVEKRHD
jgi:hypothetical protein